MPMIRVALVADTHGHLDSRIAALVEDCDIAVHGGDIGNAAVLAALQPRSGRVYAVTGNNDVCRKWPSADWPLLARIPPRVDLALPGGDLVLLHGHRLPAATRHQRLRARNPHARAVIYGHSHLLVADCEVLPWVLNPGAAGRTRTYGGPSCMILTASSADWSVAIHRFEPCQRGKGDGARGPARSRPPPMRTGNP